MKYFYVHKSEFNLEYKENLICLNIAAAWPGVSYTFLKIFVFCGTLGPVRA
jgi:hypothetical protein